MWGTISSQCIGSSPKVISGFVEGVGEKGSPTKSKYKSGSPETHRFRCHFIDTDTDRGRNPAHEDA